MRAARRFAPVLFLVLAVFLARGWVGDRGERNDASSVPATEVALQPLVVETVRVLDGDSVIVADREGRRLEVRIHGIDAPERRQPYSDVSRRNLDRMLRKKQITMIPRDRDRYERVVAKLVVGDRDVGLEQIRDGLAWHYRRYQDEQPPEERSAYSQAERRARENRTGLWKDPEPVAPWEHRSR